MGDTLRQMQALFGEETDEPMSAGRQRTAVEEMQGLFQTEEEQPVVEATPTPEAPAEPSTVSEMEALFAAPEPTVIERDDDLGILDRAWSASKSFMQGIGQPLAGWPKSFALAFGGGGESLEEQLDEIDATGKLRPRMMPGGAMGRPVDVTNPLAKEYLDATPQRRAEIRAQFSERKADVILNSSAYKAGTDMDEWFRENFPKDERFEGEFWADKVPNALGQVVPIAAEVAATRKAPISGAKYLSYGVGALQGAAMNAPGMFEDALAKGADVETALNAAYAGGAIGLTEVAPIGALFNRMDKATGGGFTRKLKAMVAQGTEEGLQEMFVETMNNAVAMGLYDPERGIWTEQTGEAGAVGFTTGAILEVLTGLLPGRQRTPSPREVDQDAIEEDATTDERLREFDEADRGEAVDDAEMVARQQAADEGGDMLDQTIAGQDAINDVETGMPETAEDTRARLEQEQALDDEAQAEFDETTAEGRIGVQEEALLAEQGEAQERREAVARAQQRLRDAGMEPEPGTTLATELEAEQQAAQEAAEAALAEPPITETPEAQEAAQRREAAQEAVQERIETDARDADRQAAEDAARAQEQQEAAERYEAGVEQVAQETRTQEAVEGVAPVMEAEQRLAEEEGRVEVGEVINPVMRQAFERAAQEAAPSVENDLDPPTPEQIEAGNYKKGHVNVSGLDISIENPRGSVRRSQPGAPKQWEQEMAHHYGYIRRTEGTDGDQIDTFIGEDLESPNVFVIDQIDQDTGNFDEHKVMIGFGTPAQARRGYLASYESGWKSGPVTQMTMPEFKAWLKESDTTQPANPSTPVAVATEAELAAPERAPRAQARARLAEPGVEQQAAEIDVQAEVNRVQQALPEVQARVVQTVEDLPDHLRGEGRARRGVRGLYDVEADQVYVVADQHASPEDVEATMLHEGVAHKGTRYVLSAGEFQNTMDEIFRDGDTDRLTAIAERYGLDPDNVEQRQEMAEEYIAEIAEAGDTSNLFQRIVARVRKALRDMGMVGTWSDNDIRQLLREATLKMEGTPARRMTIQQEAEIAETGETVQIEQNAEVAIRQLDKRMGVIEELRRCIG